jgi:hypothetical protein
VRKLETTRYKAGIPRVNDGALLFLETMLSKMKEPEKGGSRIGSSLMAHRCQTATAGRAKAKFAVGLLMRMTGSTQS